MFSFFLFINTKHIHLNLNLSCQSTYFPFYTFKKIKFQCNNPYIKLLHKVARIDIFMQKALKKDICSDDLTEKK